MTPDEARERSKEHWSDDAYIADLLQDVISAWEQDRNALREMRDERDERAYETRADATHGPREGRLG